MADHASETAISRTAILHVARLSRLSLTEEEVERYGAQLSSIVEHAADLAALDIDDLVPTAQPAPNINRFRPDVVVPSLSQDEVLAAAPSVEAGRFRVPRVLGEAP